MYLACCGNYLLFIRLPFTLLPSWRTIVFYSILHPSLVDIQQVVVNVRKSYTCTFHRRRRSLCLYGLKKHLSPEFVINQIVGGEGCFRKLFQITILNGEKCMILCHHCDNGHRNSQSYDAHCYGYILVEIYRQTISYSLITDIRERLSASDLLKDSAHNSIQFCSQVHTIRLAIPYNFAGRLSPCFPTPFRPFRQSCFPRLPYLFGTSEKREWQKCG